MTADLGGLDGSATGEVTPQPSQDGGGHSEPYRYPRPIKKKIQPVVEPEVVVITTKEVEAYIAPIFVGFAAEAEGSITFVAEDDDLQVLLML